MLLAMAEVVFEVVTVVLQCVEVFVLDLPAGATTGGQSGHIGLIDRQIGNKAVAIGDLAVRIDDFDLQPIDQQSVLAVADRHAFHPAIAMGHETRALLDLLIHRRHVHTCEPFIERLVRGRLGREQKMPADRQHRLAGWLPR